LGDRGVFVGKNVNNTTIGNDIEYITISTTGNASDFGDLTTDRAGIGYTSNGPSGRAVTSGGHINGNPTFTNTDVMDYITISTTGNATDFGNAFDLTVADNGTFPYTKFTPATPIQCTADTMLLMTQQEVGTVTPTASEMQFFFDCQYD